MPRLQGPLLRPWRVHRPVRGAPSGVGLNRPTQGFIGSGTCSIEVRPAHGGSTRDPFAARHRTNIRRQVVTCQRFPRGMGLPNARTRPFMCAATCSHVLPDRRAETTARSARHWSAVKGEGWRVRGLAPAWEAGICVFIERRRDSCSALGSAQSAPAHDDHDQTPPCACIIANKAWI